jgi:hypothetical protein
MREIASSSSAHYSPLLDMGLSNFSPSRSIFGYSHPAPARLLLRPTLIPLSGVGTTCFHYVVIKIRHLFLRPAACLTSTLLETGVGANDCKCGRDQQLNVPSEVRSSEHGIQLLPAVLRKSSLHLA